MSFIKTPSGISPYAGIRRSKYSCYYKCFFTNGKTLECSENHPFMTYNGIVLAKNLTTKNEIYSDTGGIFLKYKRRINKDIWLYDALRTNKNVYYTNGVLSHNCEFLGSTNTLISGAKLSTLAWAPPIERIGNLHIYEHPKQGHLYVIAVDTSEGQSLDYSAFTVIDCSQTPYKVVAKYYDNKITPLVYPNVIYNVAVKYNFAYCLVESNSIGSQVVDGLYNDLEYENIFSTTNLGRGGQRISQGFSKNSKFGIKMTSQIKAIGCSNLKGLIENSKLIIQDFDIISELTSFVATGPSFAAEPGCNDDLVMTLVLFSWLVAQPAFKELTDTDVRKKIFDERVQHESEQLLPFGVIDAGGDVPEIFVDEQGDIWETAESKFNYGFGNGSYNNNESDDDF